MPSVGYISYRVSLLLLTEAVPRSFMENRSQMHASQLIRAVHRCVFAHVPESLRILESRKLFLKAFHETLHPCSTQALSLAFIHARTAFEFAKTGSKVIGWYICTAHEYTRTQGEENEAKVQIFFYL